MTNLYTRKFPRDLTQINPLRSDLNNLLVRFNYSEKQINDYQLILTEYLSNLIRHTESQSDEIELTVDTEANQLAISMLDDSPLYGSFKELLDSDEAFPLLAEESGMGMLIIKQLMNDFSYHETATGCALTFYTAPKAEERTLILMVDDDPVILTVLSEYLQNKYEVITCGNVDEALSKLKDVKPALIISDIEMPECDGIEFRQKLAKDKRLNRIPFMYLTAVDDDRVKDVAISYGIDDYLTKPVAKHDLLSGVERIIRRDVQRAHTEVSLSDQAQQNKMRQRIPSQTTHLDVQLRQETAETMSGDFVLHYNDGESDYFVLGDVMGHGVDAAFYAYSYAGYIRAYFRASQTQSLAQLTTDISDAICQDNILEQQLMTMLLIKSTGDTIEMISAGHPAPLLVKDNHFHIASTKGPLLGLFEGQRFQPTTITASEYDALIAYTDGLMDAFADVDAPDSLVNKLNQSFDISRQSGDLLANLFALVPNRGERSVNDDISCLMLSSRK